MQLDNKDWFSKLEVYILGILSRLFCPNVFLFDRSDVLCLDLYAKGARGDDKNVSNRCQILPLWIDYLFRLDLVNAILAAVRRVLQVGT